MRKIPNVIIFEVQLQGALVPIWRILEVPMTMTLHELHLAIQVAMKWENIHLYLFQIHNISYEIPEPMTPLNDSVHDPREVKLKELELEVGTNFSYIYDFGDNWELSLTVKGHSRKEYRYKEIPRCSAGAMASPPEDIGGILVYNQILDFIINKKPITILPDLEKMVKKYDPYDEDITHEYSFKRAMGLLGRRNK